MTKENECIWPAHEEIERLESLFLVRLTNRFGTYITESPAFGEAFVTEIAFPHQSPHTDKVAQYTAIIGSTLGLDDNQIENSYCSALVHDLGHGAVESGHLEIEEHNLFSWFLIDYLFDNLGGIDSEVIAQAVYLHNRDVIPDNAPIEARVLNWADRLAGMGPVGLIREAYWMGFRDDAFVKCSERQMQEDGLVCDMRPPWAKDYEKKVWEYVRNKVYPFISDNDSYDDVTDRMREWADRFLGKRDLDGSVIIEPIPQDVQNLFYFKLRDTCSIMLDVISRKIKYKYGK